MKILFDQDEHEAVAIVPAGMSLLEAVTKYLEHTGSLKETGPFFSDGRETLSAAEFLNRPDLIKDAFRFDDVVTLS